MIDGEWDNFVPVKLPVDWEYRGDAGIHPDIEGVTGRQVVLLIEKKFTRFERILAKILKAPKVATKLSKTYHDVGTSLMDGRIICCL